MATKSPRSVPFKITITPELHERLRAVAAQLGQAPATVASMAVGQFVANMTNQLGAAERATSQMVERMAPEVSAQLKILMEKQ